MIDSIKYRCSSLGKLMTDSRTKGVMGDTAKSAFLAAYLGAKYNRYKVLDTDAIIKGRQVEEDSITIYSRITGKFFKKNSERKTNEWITGEPDLYEGRNIEEAIAIIDIKSSWDIWTFFEAKLDAINSVYWWQLQGYMWLTGAKTAELVYCLVDTPPPLIDKEKAYLLRKMGTSDIDQKYLDACRAVDQNMTYGDIPIKERMFSRTVNFDDTAPDRIMRRIVEGRTWLKEQFES